MDESNDNNSDSGEEIDDSMQINWFILIFSIIAVIIFSSLITSAVESNIKRKNKSASNNYNNMSSQNYVLNTKAN